LKLDSLQVAAGASYHPEKTCLEGTRLGILERLRSWYHGVEGDGGARVLLLVGQAGTGKSSVAHSFAQECMMASRLGGFFAFSKDHGPESMFRTISRSLADLDPIYASALERIIASDSTLTTTSSITLQFHKLLCSPLGSLSILGPIVIVIDALDECPVDRDTVVQCLLESYKYLPSNIRFFITSRPSEAQLLCTNDRVKTIELEPATDSEILSFVQHRLRSFPLQGSGLDNKNFEHLARSSEGLFQYAAVVCNEIRDARGESRLAVFHRLTQHGDKFHKLDVLYSSIIANGLGINGSDSELDQEKLRRFRVVMTSIMFSRTQVTHRDIIGLVSIRSADPNEFFPDVEGLQHSVSIILQPLAALLNGTQDVSATVYPLHSSFRDFLLDQSRSGCLWIGNDLDHARIASLCLVTMNQQLHFNMANLNTSYIANKDIPNFKEKVASGVSAGLSYACQYFSQHLSDSGVKDDDFKSLFMLQEILSSKFLFWIEALSLEKKVLQADIACQFLHHWLKVSKQSFHLLLVLIDVLGWLAYS
jgi:hypothetical protein